MPLLRAVVHPFCVYLFICLVGFTFPFASQAEGSLCERVLSAVGWVSRPVQYDLPNLLKRDVAADLNSLFHAYTHGLEPDLQNPEERKLFQTYLTIRFGNPQGAEIDSFLNLHIPNIYEKYPDLKKRVFSRMQVDFVHRYFPVGEDLIQFTKNLVRSSGRAKASFFEVDANIGYWMKMFGLKSEPAIDPLWSKDEIKSKKEAHKKSQLETFEKLMPLNLRVKLRNRSIPAVDRLADLYKHLDEIRKQFEEYKFATKNIRQTQLDILNVAGFVDSTITYKLRSDEAGERIQALRDLLAARDLFAMKVGFAGHFVEAYEKLQGNNATAWFPSDEKFKAKIESHVKAMEQGTPVLTPAESFEVRQLSLAESSLRSCLGGSDCSSRTYRDFAFEDDVIYFTMTSETGSSGHATLILGSSGPQRVAFLDKLQNVPHEKAPVFLEAIRRILAKNGYVLKLAREKQDHNGLSNDTSLTSYVREHVYLSRWTWGPFFKESQSRGFNTLYSRVKKKWFWMYSMQPVTLNASVGMHELPAITPFRLQTVPSSEEMVQQSLKLMDGSEDEKIRFITLIRPMINMKLLTEADVAKWLEKNISDPSTSRNLKYKFIYYVLKHEIRIKLNALIVNIPSEMALQIYHQLEQIPEIKKTMPFSISIAFAAHDGERLSEVVQSYGNQLLFLNHEDGESNSFIKELDDILRARDSQVKRLIARNILLFVYSNKGPDVVKFIELYTSENNTEKMQQFLNSPDMTFDRIYEIGRFLFVEMYGVSLMFPSTFSDLIPEETAKNILGKLRVNFPDSRFFRPSRCFVAGTKILTPDGEKNIEEINEGDQVLTAQEEDGQIIMKAEKVIRTGSYEDIEVFQVNLDNGASIRASSEHPIYSPAKKQYLALGKFKVGDEVLVYQSKNIYLLQKIQNIEAIPGRTRVYNFEVDKAHNYFSNGILVHNKIIHSI